MTEALPHHRMPEMVSSTKMRRKGPRSNSRVPVEQEEKASRLMATAQHRHRDAKGPRKWRLSQPSSFRESFLEKVLPVNNIEARKRIYLLDMEEGR